MTTVELLRKLVAVDSTSSISNVPLIDVLEAHVRTLGFETRRQTWTDAAGVAKANLIARRGPDVPGGLALVGHSDCVPYDPAWAQALAGEEREGRIYGRGSADTKGFIAIALAAAARTGGAAAAREPLHLLFTADEEVGCLGAKRLAADGTVRPRYAIVGEPTRLVPVLGHKGYCLAELIITGAEGHSAYPETGASAIFAAGRLLADLEKLALSLEESPDPLFKPPHTTLNVGMIAGGKAKNVIPGSCTLTFEWRPVPSQDTRRVLDLLERLCAQHTSGRIKVEVRPLRLDAGVAVPRDGELVRFLEQESGNAAETIPFGTELPELTAMGAQGCVFGPGDIRVAHRTGESIAIEDLLRAEEILVRAIERFCA